jgi:hypothetical protein
VDFIRPSSVVADYAESPFETSASRALMARLVGLAGFAAVKILVLVILT